MTTYLREWLRVSNEEAAEQAPVLVQESTTPKEDFSIATNEDTAAVETEAPAVAEIPAASEDAPDKKTIDQGHQEILVSQEEAADDGDRVDVSVVVEGGGDTNAEVDVTTPDTATLEPAEAGDDQKTPVADDQVSGDAGSTEVQEVSVEETEAGAVEVGTVAAPETGEPAHAPADEIEVEMAITVEGHGDEPDNTSDAEPVLPEVELEPEVPLVVPTADEEPTAEEPETAPIVELTLSDGDDEAPEINAAHAQVQSVAEDIDQFTKVSAAMEAYMDLLTAGIDRGDGITAETAVAMRIGMEALDPLFAEEQIVPSQEAFGVTSSRLTATTISLESLQENLGKVVEATKRAIQKLFELLYDLWVAMTGGASRAARRLDATIERIKGLKKDSVNKQLTVANPARLTAGVEFEGNNPKAVADIAVVATYMYKDYPDQMDKLVKEVARIYRGVLPKSATGNPDYDRIAIKTQVADAAQDLMGVPRRVLKPITGATPATSKELPPTLHRYEGVVRSKALAGDYALVQFINKVGVGRGPLDEGSASLALVTSFNRIFNVQFIKLENSRVQPSETYKLPSKRELLKTAEEIESLLKMVQDSAGNKRKYEAMQSELKKVIGEIVSKGSLSYLVHPLAGGLQNLTRLLTQPAGQFNGYVVSECNAFISLLNYNLEQFEAELEIA